MFTWAKIVQGLVSLANAFMSWREKQDNIQTGVEKKELANAKAEIQLDKQIKAIDDSFDANADRMRELYSDKTKFNGDSRK